MLDTYLSFKAIDDLLLTELLRKYKKKWRRKIERKGLLEHILYKKYRYKIDWDIFEKAREKVRYQLLTNNKDSLKKIVHRIVWKETYYDQEN